MQQDYPLYEEMVRRGSRGRWFWRVGSWLYYTGILGIVLLLIVWPVGFYFRISDAGLLFLVLLLLMAAVFTAGSLLKRASYRIALNEGIDVAKYFQQVEKDGK